METYGKEHETSEALHNHRGHSRINHRFPCPLCVWLDRKKPYSGIFHTSQRIRLGAYEITILPDAHLLLVYGTPVQGGISLHCLRILLRNPVRHLAHPGFLLCLYFRSGQKQLCSGYRDVHPECADCIPALLQADFILQAETLHLFALCPNVHIIYLLCPVYLPAAGASNLSGSHPTAK